MLVAEQATHFPLSTPASPERSSSRLSQTSTKLRYAAYDPPKVTSKLRRLSTSSSRSNSTVGIRRRDSEESLSRTFTPGELAIAAGRQQLQELSKVRSTRIFSALRLTVFIVAKVLNTSSPKCANNGRGRFGNEYESLNHPSLILTIVGFPS